MPSQQQPQQQQSSQNASDLFWMIAMAVVGIVILWHFERGPITRGIFWVRTHEIYGIKWFFNHWLLILHRLSQQTWLERASRWFQLLVPHVGNLDGWLQYIDQADPSRINFKVIKDLSLVVGYYLKFPATCVTLIFAGLLYFKHSASEHTHIMTMKKLRESEKGIWPQIAPVANAKLDLIKQPIDRMPWAMSITPMNFCKNHHLLEKTIKNHKPAVKLIKDKAARIFALQMGPLWNGPAKLPAYIQALFAIFSAKGNKDGKSANKLLDQIAGSSRGGTKGLNFSGTRILLIRHVRTRAVGYAVCRHAYLYTAMASMLELARTDGVLATSEFLWLKLIDRPLWYMLNTVGRQTAFPEISGPYAHWIIEKKLGRPMKVPMIREAVSALDEAIENILYNPEEDNQ